MTSTATQAFMRHLSLSAIGGLAGAALMFLASIVAGRALGPSQFGDAALVITLAQ